MWEYRVGHVIEELRKMPDESVQCVVTSPPYWGLRKYSGAQETVWGGDDGCEHEWGAHKRVHGAPVLKDSFHWQHADGGSPRTNPDIYETGQAGKERATTTAFCRKCGAWKGAFGLEPTIEMYVNHTVEILREIKRVLRADGVVFWNIGDSYAGSGGAGGDYNPGGLRDGQPTYPGTAEISKSKRMPRGEGRWGGGDTKAPGLKPKDKCMIPFRVALAAQADGWWVRSDIVWSKPNPMPESCTDRPTTSHEYIFVFTKSAKYYWDANAVREKDAGRGATRAFCGGAERDKAGRGMGRATGGNEGTGKEWTDTGSRNLRSVWEIATQPYAQAHFACVDSNTECLTIDGWKQYNLLRRGELAAQFDLKTQKLSWGKIEDVAIYDVKEQEVVIASHRDLDFLFSPNHRCIIHRRHPRARKFLPPVIIPASKLKSSHSLPTTAEWEDTGVSPISEQWAELLGWYISEGMACKNSVAVEIYQSDTKNPRWVQRIEELLMAVGAEYTIARAQRQWRGRPTISVAFRIIGYVAIRLRELAPEKRIPISALSWKQNEIYALMMGLIRGDGHIRSDTRMCFVQKGKETVDTIQALAIRLGWSAIATMRKGTENMWVVYFTKHKTRSLRGTNGRYSKINKSLYTGILWCPKLPMGTWIARRNGRVFITGNTFPEEIPRRCIKAATSERGRCPVCGAPWERKIERGESAWKHTVVTDRHPPGENAGFNYSSELNGKTMSGKVYAEWKLKHPDKTLGWQPTCACPPHEPIPCLVLDPFAGSGTTLAVARSLGRHAIGIDISEEYQALAIKRAGLNVPDITSFTQS